MSADDMAREAAEIMNRITEVVTRVERAHGPAAAWALVRLLYACLVEKTLGEDEVVPLLAEVQRGHWDAAAARLAEVGHSFE